MKKNSIARFMALIILVLSMVSSINYIDEKKSNRSPIIRFLMESSSLKVSLKQVRSRLAKIEGKMSDVVRELRNDRI